MVAELVPFLVAIVRVEVNTVIDLDWPGLSDPLVEVRLVSLLCFLQAGSGLLDRDLQAGDEVLFLKRRDLSLRPVLDRKLRRRALEDKVKRRRLRGPMYGAVVRVRQGTGVLAPVAWMVLDVTP